MSSALQTLNENLKIAEWTARITACRNSGLSVQEWCRSNDIYTQTYYRWQKRLFELAQAQQEVRFAEITPAQPVPSVGIAVTIRIVGVEANIHNSADTAAVEAVPRVLKSC